MESVRETQKKYGSKAMTAAILIALCFIISGDKSVGKGLILGTVFSVINFVLMGETLHMKLGSSRGKTFFLSLGTILFRYCLMAIPLIMAVKLEQFNLVAVISGIFMIQVVILVDHLFSLTYKK